jgi:hypothetical protein
LQILQLTVSLGLTLLSYLAQLATCYLPGQLGKLKNHFAVILAELHHLATAPGKNFDRAPSGQHYFDAALGENHAAPARSFLHTQMWKIFYFFRICTVTGTVKL